MGEGVTVGSKVGVVVGGESVAGDVVTDSVEVDRQPVSKLVARKRKKVAIRKVLFINFRPI